MNQTKELARGKWASILSQVIDEECFNGKHQPCPLCSGKDRYRWIPEKESYICNQCGSGTALHLLKQHQGISYHDAWKLVEKLLPNAVESIAKPKDYSELMHKLIANAVPADSNVIAYLNGRGIMEIPETILETQYNGYAAMLVQAERDGELTGIHLTLIKDGKKAPVAVPKRMLGSFKGSAVHLYPDCWATLSAGLMENVEIPAGIYNLIIAEGVETALSFRQMYKEPYGIVIAADCDANFTGQKSAYTLANKLATRRLPVLVKVPKETGKDWNDILVAKQID